MSQPRIVARTVAVLGICLLGAVAAQRLPVAYLPTWTFPELNVRLNLADTDDIERFTRTWIQPLESAIRSIGKVRSLAGEVDSSSAQFRVRFEAGVDADRKAARLESELNQLRRRLPEGASLTVTPAGLAGGDSAFMIWLPGSERVEGALLDSLRALPTVRSVGVPGDRRPEVRLATRGGGETAAAIRHVASRRSAGRFGSLSQQGKTLPIWEARPEQALGDLAVTLGSARVPISSLGDVRLVDESAEWQARVEGVRGAVLLIAREYDASPLVARQAIRRTLAAAGKLEDARFLIDEAAPIKAMLRRLGWGAGIALVCLCLAVAMVCGGLAGGWRSGLWQAATVPVALAASLNAFWLLGVGLDVTTLPALALAVGAALIFQCSRIDRPGWPLSTWLWTALTVSAVPVAVILIGQELGQLLSPPAKAFALAATAACLATALLPSPALPSSPRQARPSRARAQGPLRWALRHPWEVLLGSIAGSYVLLVLAGSALQPRPGRLMPAQEDLMVFMSFARGSDLATAENQVSVAETHFSNQSEIASYWCVLNRNFARCGLRMQPELRSTLELRLRAARYQAQLERLGSSVRVQPLAGFAEGEPLRFDDSLETRAETDEEATFYRFVLRSTDLKRLRDSLAIVTESLGSSRWKVLGENIVADWGRPSPELELRIRPGVEPSRAAAALARFADQRWPAAQSVAVPGWDRGVALRVRDVAAPASEREPRRVERSLGVLASLAGASGASAVAPEQLFTVREVFSAPKVGRQAGSFVLPVTIHFRRVTLGERPHLQQEVHRNMGLIALPAGVDLERPKVGKLRWDKEKARMVQIGLALPLLLLALAICRLDSVPLGMASLTPLILAVVWLAPWVRAMTGHVDEMTLLALAATLATFLPLSLGVASGVRSTKASPLAGATGYHWLARRLPFALAILLAWSVLMVAPGVGLDLERYPWVLPLRASGLAGGAAGLASFLFLPVLLRAVDRLRFHDPIAAKEQATPPAWQQEGSLELSARNLCKIYGDGFQALHSVEFRLQPGIIGLLGPNGAGKTTLLRMLCGLLEPSRGQVLFRGVPVTPANLPRYRSLVGFLPQSFNAYAGFTAEAFLDFWAIERGMGDPKERRREVQSLLRQVGLEDAAGRKVREFSGGMRRRIGIARSLLGAPPILIVDEPTTGLDVESRDRLRETLLSAAANRIILFSTHIASDVAAAASRILLINGGRLLFDGAATDLIEEAHGRVFEAVLDDQELRSFSNSFRVTTRVRTLEGIHVRAVATAGQKPAGRIVRPNLEEAYLARLGQAPRASERRTGSLLDLERWQD